MNKLLTIVVPVYNVENYIERCLKSIYKTSETLFDLILVDDETPDNSIRIVKEILRDYSNYTILHQSNKGLSGARNTGLNIVNTPFVWFVDSDDYLELGAIEKISNIINQKKNTVEVVHFGFNYIYADNKKKSKIAFNNKTVTGIELLNNIGGEISAWRNIYNVSFLKENHLNFYEGLIFEDLDFNIKIFSLAKNVFVFNEFLYNYDQTNSSSILHNIKLKHALSMLTIVKDIADFIHNNNVSKDKIPIMCFHAGRAFSFSTFFYKNLSKTDKKTIISFYKNREKETFFVLRNSRYRVHNFFYYFLKIFPYSICCKMVNFGRILISVKNKIIFQNS